MTSRQPTKPQLKRQPKGRSLMRISPLPLPLLPERCSAYCGVQDIEGRNGNGNLTGGGGGGGGGGGETFPEGDF